MANTPNLGLHQWDADDAFLRTDFNEDLSKIDAGIKAASTGGFAVGTYRGSGVWNVPTAVELGFAPSAVIIRRVYSGDLPVAMLTKGQEISHNNKPILKLTETGFEVGTALTGSSVAVEPTLNGSETYCYIAFR